MSIDLREKGGTAHKSKPEGDVIVGELELESDFYHNSGEQRRGGEAQTNKCDNP